MNTFVSLCRLVTVIIFSHACIANRFVCYYPNWAYYRQGVGTYSVEKIDPSLCTHFIYSFAVLNNSTFNIQVYDDLVDIANGGYSKFIGLKNKNPKLKTMIAIGGWTDSESDKYSQLVASADRIGAFVASVLSFLRAYPFDGLDIDWEFPFKEPTDRVGFANLITSLRTAFLPYGYLLSAAVSANQTIIDAGYDVQILDEQLDFVNLMAYDLHGSWEDRVDHHSPLYQRTWETVNNNNVDSAVTHWLQKGLRPGKLNVGIPLYGNSWTLNSIDSTIQATASGPGAAGPYTGAAGVLSYYEICNYISNDGWTVVHDALSQNGPYAFAPNSVSNSSPPNRTWVGYDDLSMVTVKSEYVVTRALGGAMVWDISQDDFGNLCRNGTNPLMRAIQNIVVGTSDDSTTDASTTRTTTGSSPPSAPKVVCYFPNWAFYRSDQGRYTVDSIDPTLCTHLIYAFAVLDNITFTIKVYDDWVDLSNGAYAKFVGLKNKNPNLKTMIAIGGWTDSESDKYSQLVASASRINTFVASAVNFLQQHKFDGLDLDWEYPYKNSTDKSGFASLITALKSAFTPHGYLLSAAVSANQTIIDAGYDVATMDRTLDFVGLMAYDLHGSWEPRVDHHSPLYKRPWETVTNNNVDYAVGYWLVKGLSANKLIMGIPLYGNSWTLNSTDTSYLAPAWGPGAPGPYTGGAGVQSYYEICANIRSGAWTVVQDPLNLNGPYAYSSSSTNKTWVGFDDVSMIITKSEYLKSFNLGGAMVWDISQDDFGNLCGNGVNPLLTAIRRSVIGDTSITGTPSAATTPFTSPSTVVPTAASTPTTASHSMTSTTTPSTAIWTSTPTSSSTVERTTTSSTIRTTTTATRAPTTTTAHRSDATSASSSATSHACGGSLHLLIVFGVLVNALC